MIKRLIEISSLAVVFAALCLIAGPSRLSAEAKSPAKPNIVTFKTTDGWALSAFYKAPAKRRAVAILIHGVASGKGEWDRFSRELWKRGLGTLAVDLRGHGGSTSGPGGKIRDYKDFDAAAEWPRMANDMDASIQFLRKRGLPLSRIAIVGASIGANLAAQAAASRPNLAFVVLLSPGLNYRGVEFDPERLGSNSVVAAAPADAYAYGALVNVLRSNKQADLLQSKSGHGVGMFEDKDFLTKLLDWIAGK